MGVDNSILFFQIKLYNKIVVKNKLLIPIIIAVIIILLAWGFWYWSKNRQTPSVSPSQTKETPAPTLGDKIFEKTQKPLQGQVPEANPFKKQKNPLDVIYKNPFK